MQSNALINNRLLFLQKNSKTLGWRIYARNSFERKCFCWENNRQTMNYDTGNNVYLVVFKCQRRMIPCRMFNS